MANKEDQDRNPPGRDKIRAFNIAEILQAKYAFLSGGKDLNGHLVITIPGTSKLSNINDTDFKMLFTYLLSLPSCHQSEENVSDQAYTVVLDRRKGKWSSVNDALAKLRRTFPSTVNCVFVLKPQGFLQKVFSGGLASEEAQVAFKIVVLGDVTDLHKYIEQDQLSCELGGHVEYKHDEWIEHRSAIERFDSKIVKLAEKLDMLRGKFERTEISSSIEEMEFTLASQEELWKDVKEDMASTRITGIALLKCIHPNRHKNDDENDNPVPPDVKANANELEGLFSKLHKTESAFSDFWEHHDKRIRQGMELSQFEREVAQVTGLMLSATTKVSAMIDVGDGTMAADRLLQELQTFRTSSKDPIGRARALIEKGKKMADEDHMCKMIIRMRCDDLTKSCTDLNKLIEKREEQLKSAKDIHECLEQVRRWCTKGSDLLGTQPVEKFQSSEGAEKCLEEIENFLKDRQGISLKKLNRLDHMSKQLGNKYLIQKVKDCLKRIGEVNEMMTKRENSLKRMVVKRPVQPVKALQVDTKASKADTKRKGSSASTTSTGKSSPTLKRPVSIVVTKDPSPPSPVPLTKNYAKAVSIPNLVDAVDGEDTAEVIKKRMQIMMELVATERDYVADLRCIIRGYVREFEKASDIIPEELYNKKNLIFGNIEEIYDFHNEEFLKELEKCVDSPLLVGEVFHEKRDDFEMYAVYCKNKPASESLQQDFINLPFVKEWQSKLGHKLPLTAYLLKPVQRITKYQLLLKEMMKNTRNNRTAYINLMEALQSMQSVLRHLNDVMHSRGLRGYHGNLADLGKLLLQDTFMVWHVNKRGILPKTGRPRQVFLYQHLVIFTKREEDLNSKDVVCYQFKNSIKLSEIGMTETVKQAPLKFELWLQNRSEVFVLKAVSMEEKERWITKVRSVLLNQFDQAKEEQSFKNQEYGKWKSSPTLGLGDNPDDMPKSLSFLSLDQPRGNADGREQHGDEFQDHGFESDEFDSNESEDESISQASTQLEDLAVVLEHSYKYRAIAGYSAMEKGELSIRERDEIEVVRIGHDGWWYARHQTTQQEGWVPASYLEPLAQD